MEVIEKEYYVYWYHLPEHTDLNVQGYVGVTSNLYERDKCHRNYGKGYGVILRKALIKYGDRVQRRILCSGITQEMAYEVERLLRPLPKIGWNVAVGGGLPPSCLGRKHSEETKKRISETNKLTKSKRVYANSWKGKTGRYSEEHKEHLGSFHKGKSISEEHKKAISEKNSGKDNHMAVPLILVHISNPDKTHVFDTIKHAAQETGMNYSALRTQYQNKAVRYNRKGWKILWDKG